jgi:8-oxo-dGTP pyrophosphatase MutT (NUDIX family)
MSPLDPVPGTRLSASMLLLRERGGLLEVLMLLRAAALAFGGTWAFPGGSVDSGDGEADDDPLATLRRAALRETREEAGVSLEPADPGHALPTWSRWVTPESLPRRFDAWFFATAAPSDAVVRVDGIEAVESAWIAPAAALAARAQGHMKMLPPAAITLLDLQASHALHGSVAAVLQAEGRRRIVPILPRVTQSAGQAVAVYPWDAEYAAMPGQGFELRDGVPPYLARLPSRFAIATTG